MQNDPFWPFWAILTLFQASENDLRKFEIHKMRQKVLLRIDSAQIFYGGDRLRQRLSFEVLQCIYFQFIIQVTKKGKVKSQSRSQNSIFWIFIGFFSKMTLALFPVFEFCSQDSRIGATLRYQDIKLLMQMKLSHCL